MPLKKQKKVELKKDSKTELELLIQSKINSAYSLIIPVRDDSVVFIEDPVNKLNKKFKLYSEDIDNFLKQMCDYGLLEKLDKDFQEAGKHSEKYLAKWQEFKSNYQKGNQ
jgi:Holliday junction resolvase RusA-like endonuclease